MERPLPTAHQAKKAFWQCGTCSRTFGHLLDQDFAHPNPDAEQALDSLAGGIMNHGHQCGMLWGSALAVGAEAARQEKDPVKMQQRAVAATQSIMDSFQEETETVNCREITHCDLTTRKGMARLMLMTFLGGFYYSPCFRLAGRWAPQAVSVARDSFADNLDTPASACRNCASEVVARMGGSTEEQAMVAGFVGGLGLGGHGCGALAAAIWYRSLVWARQHPDESPPMFKGAPGEALFSAFHSATDGVLSCRELTGQTFANLEEHHTYLQQGGCRDILDTLVAAGSAP